MESPGDKIYVNFKRPSKRPNKVLPFYLTIYHALIWSVLASTWSNGDFQLLWWRTTQGALGALFQSGYFGKTSDLPYACWKALSLEGIPTDNCTGNCIRFQSLWPVTNVLRCVNFIAFFLNIWHNRRSEIRNTIFQYLHISVVMFWRNGPYTCMTATRISLLLMIILADNMSVN